MRAQRAGDARERIALAAASGVPGQVGRAVGDRVVAALGDSPTFRAPCEQLLAHDPQLCAQVTRRAALATRRTGPAFAVFVKVVADCQQDAFRVTGYLGVAHPWSVARGLSRESRAS